MQRGEVTHIRDRVVGAVVAMLLVFGGLPAGAQAPAPPAGASASVLDDPLVREDAKRGLDLLYNMQFDAARRTFDRVDRRYPDHPIGPFLKALNTWWAILIDLSDTSHDDTFLRQMDQVVERADRMLRRDPDSFDAKFFKGAALGFRGRLHADRRQWFKAAMDGKRALDYVLEVAREDTSRADFVFGRGIYDYFSEAIPEEHAVVKPLMIFFPDGDRERGLRTLRRVVRDGYYIRTEAAYFLLQIHYIYEKNFGESLRYVQWLRDRHPYNAFFHTFEGRVYARWGHWKEATAIFEDVLARYRQGAAGYSEAMAEQALYQLARSAMLADDYDRAHRHLFNLEALTARHDEDTYLRVMGRLRQGMVYDALGERQTAVRRYREVLQMDDHGSAHDRARRYLRQPYRG